MAPRLDVSMTKTEVDDFLSARRTAVLTTLGSDGYPHSTGMWFIFLDGRLLMWTYAKSQKARNLARDPRCAFLVENGDSYSELRGVLVRGHAQLDTDTNRVEMIGRRLFERYSQDDGLPLEGAVADEIGRQATKRVGLILGLERVSSWDHRKAG